MKSSIASYPRCKAPVQGPPVSKQNAVSAIAGGCQDAGLRADAVGQHFREPVVPIGGSHRAIYEGAQLRHGLVCLKDGTNKVAVGKFVKRNCRHSWSNRVQLAEVPVCGCRTSNGLAGGFSESLSCVCSESQDLRGGVNACGNLAPMLHEGEAPREPDCSCGQDRLRPRGPSLRREARSRVQKAIVGTGHARSFAVEGQA